ncbi:ABC transporter ATP-binding protein [Halobacterium bonnevillei]|uniref:ABC-type D-xylose/L-arabinose transporter n=1 Tax=Halobacterium bonnevillei TaxID=2692200 RepID=A0A6B0SDT7_9EURY|nr:ABC transporter ATP-binding protein [Halobacterium bonnevillei]MXR19905.1 ATP-binding cassette domain-containing protein [Halobacterium bonnevillei]
MASPIRLDSIRKEYSAAGNTHVAVDDLTLEIPAGSFTTIVGPSGCGKTTTLRMIAGLETPTAGTIHFGDRDVTDAPPQDRNAAMVFQSIALYPHMSVRENIGYGLKVQGVDEAERDRRIEEAAETLQITAQLDKMPSELSGGQQQRVALGSAFVQDPDVLLLDEPMSDLDAKLKAELRVEVQRLHKELDATVVYVTHDQTEAMTMSDHVLLLEEGELAQFAPPGDLFDHPVSEYVARFIGTPSTNMLPATVEATGDGYVLTDGQFSVPVPGDLFADRVGDDVTLGVRPQYLDRGGGSHGVRVRVDVVEQLGTEYVVHGETTDGSKIDVVVADDAGLATGEDFDAYFEPDDLFVFDDGGDTICHGDALSQSQPA